MDADGIIPDVINIKPKALAEVIYPSGAKVDMGKVLKPILVKNEPTVIWPADSDALYMLVMVDPDAPSRSEPTQREVLHWLVINIPGNKVSEGQTVAEYVGPNPSKGTGLHRYAFIIFKQSNKINTNTFIRKTSLKGRFKVKTRNCIVDCDLSQPIAGNYYQSQYDDNVPIFQKIRSAICSLINLF